MKVNTFRNNFRILLIFSLGLLILQGLAQFGDLQVPSISQEDAMRIVAPHVAALYDIPVRAWKRYQQLPLDVVVQFTPRTRASAVHDFMVSNAHEYAASATSVRPFESNKMVGITIDARLAIRFKKLDEDSLSRNQPTQQVEDFRNQDPIEGIPAAHFLELGYVLNETETEVSEVRLAHPSGKGVAWWVRLDGSTFESVVVDLFQPQGGGEVAPPLITPKKSAEIVPLRKRDNEN